MITNHIEILCVCEGNKNEQMTMLATSPLYILCGLTHHVIFLTHARTHAREYLKLFTANILLYRLR